MLAKYKAWDKLKYLALRMRVSVLNTKLEICSNISRSLYAGIYVQISLALRMRVYVQIYLALFVKALVQSPVQVRPVELFF